MPDLSRIDAILRSAIDRVFPAAQVEIRHRDATLFAGTYGWLDPETQQRPARRDTLFDLASVTKLFVVTVFMTLVEEGRVGLDQPVSTVLPDFRGLRQVHPYEDPLHLGAFVAVNVGLDPGIASQLADAGQVTFRNLLVHNSGLPAWRPLYREGSSDAARQLAVSTHFSYPIGARVVYSDIGLILLGMSVEEITGLRLDEAVRQRVTSPLGLSHTKYLPLVEEQTPSALQKRDAEPVHWRTGPNFAPTELCAWRGRRIVGEVHDENAAALGGIAGHAGLFGTAGDLVEFGQSFLRALDTEGTTGDARPAVLRPATVLEMIRVQAEDGTTRRGLGYALWSPDPEASSNPFSVRAFGHTGFTGTSLWMDPDKALVVACLTNRVYYGRDAGGILEFRVALHRAITDLLA